MQKLIGTIVCLFFFGLLAHANAQSLKLEVHPQSNNWWLAVSDVDGAFPTSTIELREASGAWIRMSHDYNPYWRFWTYQSTSGTALTFPLSFRFTANNGAQVTFTSALVSFTGATQVIDSLLQYNGAAATPATKAPVQAATDAPVAPTEAPVAPTAAPVAPTEAPVAPTEAPVAPTEAPVAPTEAPTVAPVAPTEAPVAPTGSPTDAPTGAPTSAPVAPTEAPAPHTRRPTRRPTHRPTERPAATTRPTERPTERPAATTRPTERPTERPAATTRPTERPTERPAATTRPTERPAATTRPTTAPTVRPAATTRPTIPSTGGCGGKTKLLVPLYMYPAAVWDKVVDGASKVETVAIINPSSGPTNKPSNSFVTYMNKLEQAGVDMIGYVYTQYGSRSINSVKADINTYATQFPLLKGIFLDEVSNKADKESYYKELYNYIMGMPGWKYDIINPGAVPTAGYFDASTTIVSLENYGSAGAGSTPSYASCANKEHFSAIVHTVSSSNMRSTIDALLAKQYFGYLYVTDGAGGCCTYNTLASYYPAMVDYIASKNN